jgi:gliding motility-associated-like protein
MKPTVANSLFIALSFCLSIFDVSAQTNFCNLNIGKDTTLCFPATLVLDAGPGFQTYSWNTGSASRAINVTQPGSYHVSVTSRGTEAVNNGSFSQGNIGFSSGYNYATNLWPESTFWVGPNANNVHTNFVGVARTPPNFMVVNGSSNPTLNVWCQTIQNIIPNTTYEFSTWVSSVAPGNPAILQFRVNNVALSAAFTAPTQTQQWIQYTATWFSGSNTTATICIQNQNTAGGGNDFGLDDISFIPVCQTSDTITISGTTQANIITNNPDSLCPTPLFSGIANPAGGYWGGIGLMDSLAGTYDFSSPGVYPIYYVIPGACGDSLMDTVYIAPTPSPYLGPGFELCPGETAELGPLNYAEFTLWSTGETGSSITINDTGWFSVTQINAPGCSASDSIYVSWRCPMDPVLIVPNVFTPNNDGINDFLVLTHEYIGTFEIQVFNRWGGLVYQSTDVAANWDGTSETGNALSEGVYFYVIKYEGSEVGGEKELRGTLSILR